MLICLQLCGCRHLHRSSSRHVRLNLSSSSSKLASSSLGGYPSRPGAMYALICGAGKMEICMTDFWCYVGLCCSFNSFKLAWVYVWRLPLKSQSFKCVAFEHSNIIAMMTDILKTANTTNCEPTNWLRMFQHNAIICVTISDRKPTFKMLSVARHASRSIISSSRQFSGLTSNPGELEWYLKVFNPSHIHSSNGNSTGSKNGGTIQVRWCEGSRHWGRSWNN